MGSRGLAPVQAAAAEETCALLRTRFRRLQAEACLRARARCTAFAGRFFYTQDKFGKPQIPCFGALLITVFHGIRRAFEGV